jgi:CDP-diacylglycerol--glycerol-3-phosphate 3-phosphatidyltransferase
LTKGIGKPTIWDQIMHVEANIRSSKSRKHLPNLLSLSRIILGVLFFLLFRRGTPANTAICLGIIFAGMITDYLDGRLARRNNLVTMAGKWIDPLSDFSFFFFVYLSFYATSLMPLILLILFLLREISMYTAVRPLYIKRRMDPAAKTPGKLKTVLQNAGTAIITTLAIGYHLELLSFSTLRAVSVPLLSLMVAVSLGSMYWYIKPLIQPEEGEPQSRETRKQLLKLVISTVAPLLPFYCLYACLVSVLSHIEMQTYAVYVLFNVLYHGLLILCSLIVGKEFRLETSGEPLKRINLPLFLSFARICSVPTLVFLFLNIERINASVVVVPLLGFLFLTDLLDGFLARLFNQTTRIGRILDPAGDYLLILAISWVFLIVDFIPIWLFLVVTVRLVVQAVGIITLYFLRGYSYLKLSFLGKASVFAVFTIYGIELLEYLGVPGLSHPAVITVLEGLAAGIVGVSLLEKTISLRRSFGTALRELSNENRGISGSR